MRSQFQFWISVCLVAILLPWPGLAGTRKGDLLIAKARQIEQKDTTKDLDEALKLAEEAFATDRLDINYQLQVARLRAFAAQYHVYDGQVLRDQGKIKEAIVEFERAKTLDPASEVAPQELERTRALVNEIRRNPNANIDTLLMRPLPRKNKLDAEQFATAAPVPQLTVNLTKPLPSIKVNNQSASEVFLTVCREAKVRVLFDSEYQSRSLGLNQSLDFSGTTLDQALDYLALITKSFWKPLSGDTIFVTNDDPIRRSNYEEQVTKSFYLTNAPGAQEVTDIANTVQRVTDIKKLMVQPGQNVIIARSDADRVALAEKLVADLDKPKAEIIIDVIILSVSKNWSRELGVQILGLSGETNLLFNPSAGLNPAQVGGRTGIPLDTISKIAKGDFNVTLPGAALNALLGIGGTRLMEKAELRTIEGQKSTLRIGQRIPYATGSFTQGALGGVNTQFQYFDVGLNIDVTAKVHEPDEVSLHIESDTSEVADHVDLGGVLQPVISQRKRIADVRVKEGEINFWDIVTQRQEVKSSSGVPGLSQIPLVGRVFTNETLTKTELQVLTLLVPHIIRAPDIQNVNLMGLPSGSDQVVRLRYSTPEGRKIAAQKSERTIELPPGTAVQTFGQQPGMLGQPGMGMQQPGMGGMQQPGMGGMQQPGMGGMSQPGMGGMQQPGMGGMQQPGMGGMQQPGMGGVQQPGMGGMQQPGMGGVQQPGMGGTPQPGMGGMQQPGMGATPQPGMGGMQQPGMGGMQQPGMGAPATPGMGGMQQPTANTMQQPGMAVTPTTPGMGGMAPGSSTTPGATQPGQPPMGGMPAAPQPGMPTGPGPTQPGPSPSGGHLSFQPTAQRSTVNDNFTVELTVANVDDVSTGSIAVQFDPRLLQLTGITAGPGVSEGTRDTSSTTLVVGVGPSTRRVALLNFKVVGAGSTRITIGASHLVNSKGVEIPVTPDAVSVETVQGRASLDRPGAPPSGEPAL